MRSETRWVSGLWAALGVLGVAAIMAAVVVALTRVDFSAPTVAELVAACQRWVLSHAGLSSWLVLVLGSVGVAVVALTARSVLRQVRATRRFERRLHVVGHLAQDARVRLIGGTAPYAFSAGLVRPRIYLSIGALKLLGDDEREAVLAHERHHVRRRDPLRLLVTRALSEGLFFLPVLGHLAQRRAALGELAADEAAERATHGKRSLASALLAFDGHPQPTAAGISHERVDRLLGRRPPARLPVTPLAGAGATLLAIAALTVGLLRVADHASLALPALLGQTCMVAMAAVLLVAGAAGLRSARRLAFAEQQP